MKQLKKNLTAPLEVNGKKLKTTCSVVIEGAPGTKIENCHAKRKALLSWEAL